MQAGATRHGGRRPQDDVWRQPAVIATAPGFNNFTLASPDHFTSLAHPLKITITITHLTIHLFKYMGKYDCVLLVWFLHLNWEI